MQSSRIDFRLLLAVILCVSSWLLACDNQPQLTSQAGPNMPECKPACSGATHCVAGQCLGCVPGALDCSCRTDSSCDGALSCHADKCTAAGEASGCYSPCKQGFTDEGGQYRACSADGLMGGCLDDRTCVDGSCLTAAPSVLTPSQCQSDLDCPDFQACTAQGTCQAECEGNSDCGPDEGCDRRVCRELCHASKNTCPDGTHCAVADGENGFCEPLVQPTGTPALGIDGVFSVSSDKLVFTNIETTASLEVTNDSPRTLEFVLRKVEQRNYTRDGLQVIKKEPLPFLEIGPDGHVQKQNQVTLTIEAGQSARFALEISPDDADSAPAQWQGVLEISSEELGTYLVNCEFSRVSDGRWAGKVYYFTQFGDENLDGWLKNKASVNATNAVGNAFIQKWANLRLGKISFAELEAVVVSTITESWRWPSVQEECTRTQHQRCYPNEQGIGVYSDDPNTAPIPAGLIELPMALDLKTGDDPTQLSGRIPSHEVLHYAGDPCVQLEFADDPSACAEEDDALCVAFIKSLSGTVVVGGRYATDAADTQCTRAAKGFDLTSTPSLVQGFSVGTTLDSATGGRYRTECRDRLQPFDASNPEAALNTSFAGSNPIPDARSRVRTLELVDGALVNQEYMYIIIREHFASFMGASDTAGFSSYGLMVLRRANAHLTDQDFQCNPQKEERPQPDAELEASVSPAAPNARFNARGPTCPDDLIQRVLGAGAKLDTSSATSLAQGLLYGQPLTGASPTQVPRQQLHYFCQDRGIFDQGEGPNEPTPCPAASRVTYFALTDSPDMASLPCQATGTCGETLDNWVNSGAHGIESKLVWRCSDPNSVYCDDDRDDLLKGKTFYYPEPAAAVFVPLLPEIDDAFRYKTRFRNREGTGIGFAPAICAKNSNSIPYCYDPPQIEDAAARIDCLTYLFSEQYGALEPATRDAVASFLKKDYSCDGCDQEPMPTSARDGFERLYAELLVMLGDESYTNALKSRFDLAESGLRSFEGSKFEPSGIDLSGVAGFEMYKLYQAVEYYQLVLNRFYAASPFIRASLKGPSSRNFITQRTVTMYFGKVLRASTQSARAWSEIGKRYQSFNRPDLARRVIQRAYTSAYIESIVASRMMQTLVSNPGAVSQAEHAQLQIEMDRAARTYRAALLDMREVYAKFTDDINYFGFPADYVPLPALEPNGPNAFEAILEQAKTAVATASAKEDIALSSNRSFDTDSAAFQQELATLKSNYENQLADICGTFKGDDGNVYAAIPKYAYTSDRTRTLGNPCGLTGTGKLSEAMGALDLMRLDAESVVNSYNQLEREIEIEAERVSAQCKEILTLADFRWKQDMLVADFKTAIEISQQIKEGIKDALEDVKQVTDSADCLVLVGTASGTNCPQKSVATSTYLAAKHIADVSAAVLEASIIGTNRTIEGIKAGAARWETERECDVARVESDATTSKLALGFKSLDIEGLKVQYRARVALSGVESLRNQATRLVAEQQESEQLSINLEAARNDPNVRIYKNDAVVNADKTFEAALRETYRATKVFQYYTSQSYQGLVRLGLVRMVSRGDYNLENYLADLENSYRIFLETAGRPDQRVDVLSLRDDVLQIPFYDEAGTTLTQTQRIERFRAALTSSDWLDGRGYRVFPFRTSLTRLSPLTRNHKIAEVEAEVIGADVGDTLGRVYLSQKGTAEVRALDDSTAYYRFPARTSVINTFFNGVRVFDQEVYRNDRLRDRPYANSAWELLFNQRDESVNSDIDLNSLSDIRLYIHYQDFTEL